MEINPETRKKLIVSADDFGLRIEANEKILQLIRQGKIDRVAILADGQYTQAEIRELLQSGVKLDIHLDIETHKSAEQEMKQSVAKRVFLFFVKYLAGKMTSEKIRLEWKRQTKKFIRIFGQKPDGINSHEHLHFFPAYFAIALSLADQFDIGYIRLGKKRALGKNNPAALVMSLFSKKNQRLLEASKLASSDFLVSFDWIGSKEKFFQNLPAGKIEIVFHPERKEEFEAMECF